MSYLYNPPTNITDITDFFIYSDTLADNMLGLGWLVVIFMVAFINFRMRNHETIISLRASLFITTIASMMLAALGFGPDYAVIVLVALDIITLFIKPRFG